jgi:hypothetical protein
MSAPVTTTGGSFVLTASTTSLTINDANITTASVFWPVPAPGADPQAQGLTPFIRVVAQTPGTLTLNYPSPGVDLPFNYFLMTPGATGAPVSSPVSYDVFLQEVLPYVPECPELLAENAVRNAVIEFCKKSMWYVGEYTVDLVANYSDYQLSLPPGTELVAVQGAFCDNIRLKPAGEDDLKRLYGFDWRNVSGSPAWYTQLVPDTLRFTPWPVQNDTGGVKLIAALSPTLDSTLCDGTIYTRWLEGIGYGAKARLMELPQQSFTDAQGALVNRQRFMTAIGEARIERNRGFTRATLRVRPPKFV